MQVDIFDFDLDRSLIAAQPANPRDASRLLDLSIEGRISDRHFYDLPDILRPGDLLVFNDTKVIPARLYGARGEAKVEVTLYRPVDGIKWWAFIKNAKRLHPGDKVYVAGFGWVEYEGPNHSKDGTDIYENGNKIGIIG